MSDTPERIWADAPSLFDGMDLWHETQSTAEKNATEYVRADLVAAKDEKMDWCEKMSMDRLEWVRDISDLLGEALSEIEAKDAEIARLRGLVGRYGLNVGDAEGVDFACGSNLTPQETVEVIGLIDLAEYARAALNIQHKGEAL